MPTIGFTQNSVLSSGNQTFALSGLIEISHDLPLPQVVVLRAYDRDIYAGSQTFDYGKFSSPLGGVVSAGTQSQPTSVYFDLVNGSYVSRATGESLSAYTFTSSAQNFRSVYFGLFTNDLKGASLGSEWIDPQWTHLSDLNIVTRTNYVDPTPNVATPLEIAAIAKSFVGQAWNKDGCWLLTSNISAAAGASLPIASAFLDNATITGNGQWQIVFNGAKQSDDWRSLLQVGDVVELGWVNGQAHIATVTSGSGHTAMWVDNSGSALSGGTPSDIVIQPEHSVDEWTVNASDKTVIVFRLGTSSSVENSTSTLAASIAAPTVAGYSQSLQVGHSISVASLFSVQDPNLLAMKSYQIVDHSGQSHINLNGATNLATPERQASGIVVISANDLHKLTCEATLGPDSLTITAFNGQSWGSADLIVTGWNDPPPIVMGSTVAVHATSQALPVSTLFTASCSAGRSIVQYRFIDQDHTGQLSLLDPRLNLATNNEAAQGICRISAQNLDSMSWKVLADRGTIAVSAFDGVQWSDFSTVTIAGLNHSPTVNPAPRTNVSVGVPVPVTNFFTVSDSDNDPITMVSIYDYYDNIQLNGAIDHCPFPHAYQVTIGDLSKVTYTAPSVMGGLQGLGVNAYDGTNWSSMTQVTFTIDDLHPVVSSSSGAQVPVNQTVSVAQLFSVVAPRGSAIVRYKVEDPSGGGTVRLNGAVNLATDNEKARGISVFSATDLSSVTYTAASVSGSEPLRFSAFDDSLWGTNSVSVYSSDDSSPSVWSPPTTLDPGRTVKLSQYVAAYASGGKPITQYLIYDPEGAGILLLNGATNLRGSGAQSDSILISGADIDKIEYVSSSSEGSETLRISAFDGNQWGYGDLLVTTKNFGRPVVTATDITVHAGASISLQDLFKTSDPTNAALAAVQINDSEQRLLLNGALNQDAAEQYKGFYVFNAGDLPKVVYVAGDPGVHTVYVEAGNKLGASSLPTAVTITVLSNPVVLPTTTTVGIHQSIAVTDLFQTVNPSGHALSLYKLSITGSGGSLFLNGAANLASLEEQALGVNKVSASDLAKLKYSGAGSFSTDVLHISAFDGESWGSGDVSVVTIDGSPPVISPVSATSLSVELHSTVQLSGLFVANSHSGQSISYYKISNPNGGGKLALNGAFNSALPSEQAQDGTAIVSAADLGKLQYVGSDIPGTETLLISAFDGQSWGSAYLPIASVKTDPPIVRAETSTLEAAQAVALKSLFALSIPSGHAISYFIFQDPSGNIMLNGAVNHWALQQSAGYYWIDANDIENVSYSAKTDGVYRFSVIANDGYNFSDWSSGLAVIGAERLSLPPSVKPAASTVALGQVVDFSRLFAVYDPLAKAITQYSVQDPGGAGSILINGAVNLASPSQQAQGIFVFAATDLPLLQYMGATGSATETIAVGAYDGSSWGSADIAVTSTLLPPSVKAANTEIEISQVESLSALFTATTTSGSPINEIKIQDPTGGGDVLLNGATNLANVDQRQQGIAIISTLDLAQVQYVASATAGSETLLIGAFDGQSWGVSNIAVTTHDDRPPEISQHSKAVDLNVPVVLSSLVDARSISGRPILEYSIQDPSGGGLVLINSATNLATAQQKADGITVIAAYDLANMLYVGGSSAGKESLIVSAYDGQNSNAMRVELDSVVPVPPVVKPFPITIHVGDRIALSALTAISDQNGHAIKTYRVLDPSQEIDLNGAANAAVSPLYDYHGIYDFNSVVDWNKVLFVGHDTGIKSLVVQVDDGFNVSAIARLQITVVDPLASISVIPTNLIPGVSSETLDSLYNFFAVAFDAAPGALYLNQLIDAYKAGMSVKEIVDVFSTKPQFTDVYPTNLTYSQLATQLVENIVKTSATQAVKEQAIADIESAMEHGFTRSDVLYQVFGNLSDFPITDPIWGHTAQKFNNEVVVAKYYTEIMGQDSTDLTTLRAVIANIDSQTDVSSPVAIATLIGVELAAVH